MAGLRKITIEGFRSIAAIQELDLRPINILIGANGSGKSNFLEAFQLLRVSTKSGAQLYQYIEQTGGADRLLHFGSKLTQTLKLRAWGDEDPPDYLVDYGIELRHGADDKLYSVISQDSGTEPTIPVNDPNYSAVNEQRFRYDSGKVDRWRLYHFLDTGPTSPIKRIGDLDDNRLLREDASNLAAFLYMLSKQYPVAYDLIRKTVRLAAPFFDDFALQPRELNEDQIRLEWRHNGSDAYFNASSLSDGTLRFIALTTLLLQPESLRPTVILLDEPEIGLHPCAIELLASLLRRASIDSQVIAATQSPILVDHFEPEDVLVADRMQGATKLRRLDSERLKVWLEDYSLGELWEKNHFGGRASSWSDSPARKQ